MKENTVKFRTPTTGKDYMGNIWTEKHLKESFFNAVTLRDNRNYTSRALSECRRNIREIIYTKNNKIYTEKIIMILDDLYKKSYEYQKEELEKIYKTWDEFKELRKIEKIHIDLGIY